MKTADVLLDLLDPFMNSVVILEPCPSWIHHHTVGSSSISPNAMAANAESDQPNGTANTGD